MTTVFSSKNGVKLYSQVGQLGATTCFDNVKWKSLGGDYYQFHYPDDFNISFPDNKKDYVRKLKDCFPQEKDQISRYFSLLDSAVKSAQSYFAFKLLPINLDKFLTKILNTASTKWWTQTTEEVLDHLGISNRLKSVLTAQWGYYGSTPLESSFALHAMVAPHFSHGAY
ncbi:MAG: hypothetical protein HOE90_22015 [Bacteriovoracaceae bacterium]|jgi:all-trans-retinol 13,14-reductase|nr:hypothetical protein [Bacteriovoracaceae bacterium]